MVIRRRIRNHLAVYLVLGMQEADGRRTEAIARAALAGGVTMVQWREKESPLRDSIETARRIRALCREAHVPFVVNDRIDIALLLDADGVHVGQDDMPCSLVRRLLGSEKIVGVSAGSMQEADWAVSEGPDYLGVGPIYATKTKADAGEAVGPRLINDIKSAYGVPIVGIGGIHADNVLPVLYAGADGVAVVSAITGSRHPEQAAAALRHIVKTVHPL
jgi:thiamine-phosphate pyrophosphorylase